MGYRQRSSPITAPPSNGIAETPPHGVMNSKRWPKWHGRGVTCPRCTDALWSPISRNSTIARPPRDERPGSRRRDWQLRRRSESRVHTQTYTACTPEPADVRNPCRPSQIARMSGPGAGWTGFRFPAGVLRSGLPGLLAGSAAASAGKVVRRIRRGPRRLGGSRFRRWRGKAWTGSDWPGRLCVPLFPLHFFHTESAPIGLWRAFPAARPGVGDVARFCMRVDQARMNTVRPYAGGRWGGPLPARHVDARQVRGRRGPATRSCTRRVPCSSTRARCHSARRAPTTRAGCRSRRRTTGRSCSGRASSGCTPRTPKARSTAGIWA